MRAGRARSAVTALGGVVVLVAAVVGPAAADDQTDPESQVEVETGDGRGHAYGQAARPADGGGLARGHLKAFAPGRQDPLRAKGAVDHVHGDGHAVGHQHGDGLAPGHTHGNRNGLGKGNGLGTGGPEGQRTGDPGAAADDGEAQG